MSERLQTLSSLAASILLPPILGPAAEEPETVEARDGQADRVRRPTAGPRLTEDVTTPLHRPSGHGV